MTDPPVHDLLLALAGRLDDDLLAWARELVAVGEADQAVELTTAALAAERVELPPALRASFVAAARVARTDLDVERALPPGVPEHGTPHRFDADAADGSAVAAVLTAIPARRLSGCRLHLTWRRTPAGSAPGPLPRAVLLVEADPDRSADLLAYLITAELGRAGTPASVEVFTAATPLPAYHAAALRTAHEVTPGGTDGPGTAAPITVPAAGPRHGGTDAPTVTPTPLSVVPLPDGPAPPRVAATGRRHRADPVEPARPEPAPVAGGPTGPTGPASDPLNGPLRAPLLAPLLDPTGARDPRTGDVDAFDPAPTGPDTTGSVTAVPPRAERPSRPAPDGPGGTGSAAPGGSDAAGNTATGSAEPPDEWADDWHTGTWAMPRDGRPGPDPDPAPPPDGGGATGSSGPSPSPAAHPDPAGAERTGRAAAAGRRADADLVVRPAGTDDAGRTGDERPPGSPAGSGPGDAERTGNECPGRPGGHVHDAATGRRDDTDGRATGRRDDTDGRATGRRDDTDGRATGRRPDGDVDPDVVREPPAEPGEVSLFESPTARVRPAPPPSAPTPPPASHPSAVRPPAGPPRRTGPPFGSAAPGVPLFDDAPPRPPAGTPAEGLREGRRRRPDPDESAPVTSADTGHPAGDPEPSALLGATERDLLARLQAELADRERRPRPYRRAGGNNGSAHAVNGHGHGTGPDDDRPPPDLAD